MYKNAQEFIDDLLNNGAWVLSEELLVKRLYKDIELKEQIIEALDDLWSQTDQQTGYTHQDLEEVVYQLGIEDLI